MCGDRPLEKVRGGERGQQASKCVSISALLQPFLFLGDGMAMAIQGAWFAYAMCGIGRSKREYLKLLVIT